MSYTALLCSNDTSNEGCGNITEHAVSGDWLRCTACGYKRRMPNDRINARIHDIDIELEAMRGRMMILIEERTTLEKARIYLPPPIARDPWKHYDTALACVKCGRPTKWGRNAVALHKDGCPPAGAERHSNKLVNDPRYADLVNMLFSDDEPLSDDEVAPEIIKKARG